MTTIVADLAAITLDATELALAKARGTSGPMLINCVSQMLNDLTETLEALKAISSTNTAAIAAIEAKVR